MNIIFASLFRSSILFINKLTTFKNWRLWEKIYSYKKVTQTHSQTKIGLKKKIKIIVLIVGKKLFFVITVFVNFLMTLACLHYYSMHFSYYLEIPHREIALNSAQIPSDFDSCNKVERYRHYVHNLRRNTKRLYQLLFRKQSRSSVKRKMQKFRREQSERKDDGDLECSDKGASFFICENKNKFVLSYLNHFNSY